MPENNVSKVISMVAKISGKKNIKHDTRLLDSGVLDSLLTMKLIETIEKNFSISIPTSEFTHFNFNTVNAISGMIERIVSGKNKKKK
ncbi:MAG TPA: phosphopantetheine-binding protein [Victivallales bacterium]|nr:phosphopantetheine-binding protein [Victivallales bacterium]